MDLCTDAPAELSSTLLHATLQNRLRVIGCVLDAGRYRDVAVFEVDDGFLVRATAVDHRRPRALEFTDAQFPSRMRAAMAKRGRSQKYSPHSPLLPTGYEDSFRALGFLLDRQSALGVTIIELTDHILVAGSEPVQNVGGHQVFRRFERYFDRGDIQSLLDDAFKRRTTRRRGLLGIF